MGDNKEITSARKEPMYLTLRQKNLILFDEFANNYRNCRRTHEEKRSENYQISSLSGEDRAGKMVESDAKAVLRNRVR